MVELIVGRKGGYTLLLAFATLFLPPSFLVRPVPIRLGAYKFSSLLGEIKLLESRTGDREFCFFLSNVAAIDWRKASLFEKFLPLLWRTHDGELIVVF